MPGVITFSPTFQPIIVNVIQPAVQAPTGTQQVELVGQPLTVNLPGLEGIAQQIQDSIAAEAASVAAIANTLEAELHQLIADEIPKELDYWQQQVNVLTQLVGDFQTAFPAADSVANGFKTVVVENWDVIKTKLDELLSTAATDGFMNGLTELGAGGAPRVMDALNGLPGGACVSAMVKGFLLPIAGAFTPIAFLELLAVANDILRSLVDAALSGPMRLLEQDSMACAVPTLLAVGEIQESLNRGLIDDDKASDQLHRHGYDENLQLILRRLAAKLIERDDVLDGELRGMLDPQQALGKLAELGYLPDDAALLVNLRQLLPTPTDLVRFMLRDLWPAPFATAVIDDHGNATFTESTEQVNFVEQFGMDLEFPQASLEWFDKLGIPREWAHRHWQAHWELPSPEQAFQMLFRAGLPMEALTRLLRARGIEPYWRDFYTKIAFHPITRVDIRRVHKMGLLTYDQLVDRYKQLGYSDDNAKLQADFTVRLNATTEVATKLNEVANVKTHVMTAYENGTLSQGATLTHLTALGFPKEHIDAFIAEADYLRQQHIHDQIRTAVKRLYVQELWTKDQATAELTKFDFDPFEIQGLFESWDLDLDYKELTDERKAHKELAKAEVIAAYDEHVITRQVAKQHLIDLHYSDQDAEIMLLAAEHKRLRTDQTAEIQAIQAQFEVGSYDKATATGQLDALGLSPQKRNALIAKWELEIRKKGTRLTVAQITSLAKANLITAPEVREELDREGYRQIDIDRIIVELGLTDAAALSRVTASMTAATAAAGHQQQVQ